MEIAVKDLISSNLEVFFKLDLVGVKSISSAIDLMHIYKTYQEYLWIDKETERKKVVAQACKVSVSTVEKALCLMNKQLKIHKKNPTLL